MHITIRKHEDADLSQIYDLIKELALFEKVPEKLTNTLEQMIEEKEHFHALVAVASTGRIVGYATYNPVYFTWSGKSIYMDDLYIKSSHRSLGIGSKLMEAIIDYSKSIGCHKIRWQVSEWNTPAIEFYKKLGVEINYAEKNCDLIL